MVESFTSNPERYVLGADIFRELCFVGEKRPAAAGVVIRTITNIRESMHIAFFFMRRDWIPDINNNRMEAWIPREKILFSFRISKYPLRTAKGFLR